MFLNPQKNNTMKILSSENFTDSEKKEIQKQVLKQIQPSVAFRGNIKIKINDVDYFGSFQGARSGNQFIVEKKEISKNADSILIKNRIKNLEKLSKKELYSLCETHEITYEKDNNKATLVTLLSVIKLDLKVVQ